MAERQRDGKTMGSQRGPGATAHLWRAPESGASGLRSRKRGRQVSGGQTGCSAGQGGTWQQPLPTSPFNSGRWEKQAPQRHPGPGTGSTPCRALAVARAAHVDMELAGMAEGEWRPESHGMETRGPAWERLLDAPNMCKCTQTQTHVCVGTQTRGHAWGRIHTHTCALW